MPRTPGGEYVLPEGQPVLPGTVISSDIHNALANDVKDALTDSLSRTGKGGMFVPFRASDGSSSSPSYSFMSSSSAGMYYDNDRKVVGFSTRGIASLEIDNGVVAILKYLTSPMLRATSDSDQSPNSTDHGFQIGINDERNLRMDTKSIQAVNDGTFATLDLNPFGGSVLINGRDVSDPTGSTAVESIVLTDGQVEVLFSHSIMGASFFLSGENIDDRRLPPGDFDPDPALNKLTLKYSYPDKTVIGMHYISTPGGTATDFPYAIDIRTDPTEFEGNLSAADVDVQKALKTIDDFDIEKQDSENVPVNTSEFNKNLSASDDTVQKALNTIDEFELGGGGTPTPPQDAVDVPTDTTNFNGNLSSSDTDVQKALDTLDNMSTGGTPPAEDVTLDTTNFDNNLSPADDDVQKAMETIDNMVLSSGDYYEKSEFINTSAGVADAGKPIVLDGQGQIDSTMISIDPFYYVGEHDPSGGTEYPDTSGESHGAFWMVSGMSGDYTFTGGDLSGRVIGNADFMIWGSDGWSIKEGTSDPSLYYRIDGTVSITAPFAGGGFEIANIADATADNSAITRLQADGRFLATGGTAANSLLLEGQAASAFAPATHDQAGTTVTLDTTNFDNNLTTADDTVQKAMETLDDMVAGGAPPATDVSVDTTNFDGNLTPTEDTVQKALDKLDDMVAGGAPPASGVTTDVTNFDGNLSADDTDVQKALEKFDDLTTMLMIAPSALWDGTLAGLPTPETSVHTVFGHIDNFVASTFTTVIDNFDGILSATDTNIQLALDTLDDHNHDSQYAPANHNHDTDYLAIDGTATNSAALGGVAASGYSLIDHNHDSDYLDIDGTAANSEQLGGQTADKYLRSDIKDTLAEGVEIPANKAIYLGSGGYLAQSSDNMHTNLVAQQGNIYFSKTGNVPIVTVNTGVDALYCIGDVIAFSDIRRKKNLEIIPDALEKVCRINGYTFERSDLNDGRRMTGVIAQELEKVLPEAVYELEDDNGMKSVAYGNIVGLLIESIKDLKSEIDELKKEIKK